MRRPLTCVLLAGVLAMHLVVGVNSAHWGEVDWDDEVDFETDVDTGQFHLACQVGRYATELGTAGQKLGQQDLTAQAGTSFAQGHAVAAAFMPAGPPPATSTWRTSPKGARLP